MKRTIGLILILTAYYFLQAKIIHHFKDGEGNVQPELAIYKTGNSNSIHVVSDKLDNIHLVLNNEKGQILFNEQINTNDLVSLENLPAGLYDYWILSNEIKKEGRLLLR